MRVELRLYIDYDSGDFEDIRMQLYDAAEHLYDNGLLTGNDTDITITGCAHNVEEVKEWTALSAPTGPEGEKK